jgi:glycerol-3-phosphate dehydrogenase (NAD(P)+)
LKTAVLGAGSWGTVFAKVLADAGGDVTIWGRRPEVVEAINNDHRNPGYLGDLPLPERLRATGDVAEAFEGASYAVLAVPAQTLRANLSEWRPLIAADAVLVSLMKGIEVGTCKRMSEVVREVGGVAEERIAVISGPNLAREIAMEQPSAAVVACTDEPTAQKLQLACMTPYFRAYTNLDVTGCELGGSVKNVIALAVGIAVGMGMGDNVRALLMTRGLAEIARLGAALGADQHTFAGLAGIGDLVATCSSPLSRNRTFGENLGRGMSLDEVIATTKQTAEGVKSCDAVLELARRHHVEMPITEGIVAVMHGGLSPVDAGRLLMSRTPKPERYGV